MKFYFIVFIFLFISKAEAFEVFGTIRNAGNGFYVINDAGHAPLNICNIQTTDKVITFDYCGKIAKKVNFLLVMPDETYATKGINAGASVGLDKTIISVGNIFGMKSPKKLTEPGGNFWIYGRFEE